MREERRHAASVEKYDGGPGIDLAPPHVIDEAGHGLGGIDRVEEYPLGGREQSNRSRHSGVAIP